MSSQIQQYLYSYIQFSDVTWKSDIALQQPILFLPRNGENVLEADPGAVIPDFVPAGTLVWYPVPSADYYIIQWCKHSSFAGPTLRAVKIPSSSTTTIDGVTVVEYSINASNYPIDLGDEVHWRVMAYSNAGGISPKSEARSFKYDSPKPKPNPKPTGPPADQGLCDKYHVKIEINGPNTLLCCDVAPYHGSFSFTCETAEGESIITQDSFVWTLPSVLGGGDGVSIQGMPSKNLCLVAASCSQSLKATLTLTLNFTEVATGTTFSCSESIDFFVDCAVPPGQKPWLYPYGYAPNYYLNPSYVDTPMGSGGKVVLNSGGGTVLGQGPYYAVGPVMQTAVQSSTSSPDNPTKCGGPPVPVKNNAQTLEARIPLPLPWSCYQIQLDPNSCLYCSPYGLAFDPCCSIFANAPYSTSPSYVIGIDSYGCLVKVPVVNCP